MALANLNKSKQEVVTGNDNVVIVDVMQSIRGGRTLDVTGFKPDVINAGHVIIMKTEDKTYKPMPLNSGGTEYGALPGGHEYAGILISTISKDLPLAAILVRGTVNPAAAPFKMTTIIEAVKKALPLIDFRED